MQRPLRDPFLTSGISAIGIQRLRQKLVIKFLGAGFRTARQVGVSLVILSGTVRLLATWLVRDTYPLRAALLQLRVLRFGSDEDGNVGIGVFPEREEIFVGGEAANAGGVGVGAP
jgi:hypothetical protein